MCLLWGRVVELKLVPSFIRRSHPSVAPQPLNGIHELWWESISFDLNGGGHDGIVSVLIGGADGNLHNSNTFKQNPRDQRIMFSRGLKFTSLTARC
jgi:hypothetical protein